MAQASGPSFGAGAPPRNRSDVKKEIRRVMEKHHYHSGGNAFMEVRNESQIPKLILNNY